MQIHTTNHEVSQAFFASTVYKRLAQNNSRTMLKKKKTLELNGDVPCLCKALD